MHIGTYVTRALAITTTLAVASLGAVTTAQAMDPGQADGHGNGQNNGQNNGQGNGQNNGQGNGHGKGNGKGNGKQNGHPADPHDKGSGKQPDKKAGEQPGSRHGDGGHAYNGHAHNGHGTGAHGNGGHGNGGHGATGHGGAGATGTGTGRHGDPPGNNGTVKITPPGEDDGVPQNHPHQGCVLDIEWYGFDEGADIVSTVVLEDHAPTADGGLSVVEGDLSVFVGGDPAGGGTDLDGEETYRLGFTGEPHPQQGYHVKLTVHTPGSRGADTKHKVFWVTDCEEVAPPTETPTTPGDETTTPGDEITTPGDETTTPGDETTTPGGEDTTSPPDVAGTESSSPPPLSATETEAGPRGGNGPDVKGVQATAPNSSANLPTAVDAGVATIRWVASPLPVLIVLLGGLLAGLGYLIRRRNA